MINLMNCPVQSDSTGEKKCRCRNPTSLFMLAEVVLLLVSTSMKYYFGGMFLGTVWSPVGEETCTQRNMRKHYDSLTGLMFAGFA